MAATGFDGEKYARMQADEIRNRLGKFGGKLYMEIGGKIFDDYHAARVLPGFRPDSKIRMLSTMKDELEAVICVNCNDIEKSKVRGDIGITYDLEALRMVENWWQDSQIDLNEADFQGVEYSVAETEPLEETEGGE